mgnify:CR=1 FL=1|tara:strand:- start:2180 stop:5143 length:2964 start_codon:yes stop_codon:yes gene_type:complete
MASGARKFKFISPGVFVNEIDRSQLPNLPSAIGPVVIGRTRKGPGLRPVQVGSFEDFVRIFGTPDPGTEGPDNWRNNSFDAPTYGPYGAQAWLASGQAPVTVVRLLGAQHNNYGTGGEAGWALTGIPTAVPSTNAGAYGLFLINSSSTNNDQSGCLAAVWYVTQGNNITLSGTLALDISASAVSGTSALFQSSGDNSEFKAIIADSTNTVLKNITFNFNRNSERYIRRVFNTNPAQTNNTVVATADREVYWLGETYDQFIGTKITNTTSGQVFGGIAALYTASSDLGEALDNDVHQSSFLDAETPYIRSQDLEAAASFNLTNQQQLFKFVALGYGEWANANIKVSISNIRAAEYPEINPYGTFSVLLRQAADTDNAPRFLERFDLCDLNPNSENYIARKIGDRHTQWDDSTRRYREYGDYANLSDYVRVVVHENVANGGTVAELLPWGYFGPPRYNGFSTSYLSASVGGIASSGPKVLGTYGAGAAMASSSVTAGTAIINAISASETDGSTFFLPATFTGSGGSGADFSGSFLWPQIRLRLSASDGAMSNPTDAYFGIQTTETAQSLKFDKSYGDLTRPLAPLVTVSSVAVSAVTEASFAFTMDDIVSGSTAGNAYYWASGSRSSETSYTATGANTYKTLLDAGYDQFTVPLHGGFDGLNITEKDPFRNTYLSTTDATELTNYGINSVKRAIDCVRDPEVVEMNLMTAPGIWAPVLTDHLRSVCEERGDTLGVIDIQHSYTPSAEGSQYDTPVNRAPDIAQAISGLRNRSINSSYACTFFPWVQVRDTLSGRLLPVPASIPALGTFGSSQAKTELWFAPAGFVRGGLSNGAAGIPVTGVKMRLTSKNRDDLYAANINPIATFPNEGIVIFGQKTLQITPSALDRINVRRLMIFVKKEISRIANTILFEPNIQVTWDRFTGAAEPFLADVKARFGLTDFRVVLDKTTTTDDMIDRNILYAKIFLKPARSIEFIALDFIITRTGASFDD